MKHRKPNEMELTVNQIAFLASGTVEGDGQAVISSFAKIEEGKPGTISFLANPKYEHFIYTTGSTAVLVARDFKPSLPVAATLIRVDDPYATVAYLLTEVQKMLGHESLAMGYRYMSLDEDVLREDQGRLERLVLRA